MMKRSLSRLPGAAALSVLVLLLFSCPPIDLLDDIQQKVTAATSGYTLTLTATTGGTVTPSGATTVQQNASTSISAVADSGCDFAGWTLVSGTGAIIGNASSPSTTVVLSSSDATIRAGFIHLSCDLTLQCAAGGTISAPVEVAAAATSGPHTIANSVPTTITAAASIGYTFKGWSVVSGTGVSFADASNPSTTVTLSIENATIKADFLEAGTVWTKRTMPSKQNWSSVIHDGSQFVAIASGSAPCAATSPDGITWTPQSLPTNQSWNSVAYGDGKYVATVWWDGKGTAPTDAFANSTDGITWTGQTGMPSGKSWISVAYGLTAGGGVFVAVPGSGCPAGLWPLTSPLPGGPSTQSSQGAAPRDGINWDSVDLIGKYNWYSVCYGNGKFVAVAYDSFSSGIVSGTDVAAWSTDGYIWNRCSLPETKHWTSVTCGKDKLGNDLFVAVAGGPAGAAQSAAAHSHDGITWHNSTIPAQAWQSVTYGNGRFVAVPWAGNTMAKSADGESWQVYSRLPYSGVWESVTYGAGKFVAVVWGESLSKPGSLVAATSP